VLKEPVCDFYDRIKRFRQQTPVVQKMLPFLCVFVETSLLNCIDRPEFFSVVFWSQADFFKWMKKLSQFSRSVWKGTTVNAVSASFYHYFGKNDLLLFWEKMTHFGKKMSFYYYFGKNDRNASATKLNGHTLWSFRHFWRQPTGCDASVEQVSLFVS